MYRTTFRILETEDEHFYAQSLFDYHWPLRGFDLPETVLRKVHGQSQRPGMRRLSIWGKATLNWTFSPSVPR